MCSRNSCPDAPFTRLYHQFSFCLSTHPFYSSAVLMRLFASLGCACCGSFCPVESFFRHVGGFALRPTMLSALLRGGRILQQRVFASRLLGPSLAVWPRPRKKAWRLSRDKDFTLHVSNASSWTTECNAPWREVAILWFCEGF